MCGRKDEGRGSAAGSALSQCGSCEVRQSQQWEGAGSLSAVGDVGANVYSCLCVAGTHPAGKAANCGDDAQWQWRTRYSRRVAGQPVHGDWGIKKKAGALSPVNKRVVAGGCPDAVTVEVRRVEAAEIEERWSFVQSKAHQALAVACH